MFTVTLLLSLIPMNHPTHWDPLEYYPCTFAPLCFLLFSLFSSPSHSSVCILFRLPHFARPASRKSELQKNYLSDPPVAHCETQGCFGDSRVNFTARKNFPNTDWRTDLRTQLKAFVDGVCLRSKRFFVVLFSRINVFAWSRHFKELQLKGNFFDCPQIWTIAID